MSDTIPPVGQGPAERCGFLLGRVGKIASRRFTKALEETGLKPPQAAVLMTLCDRGPMTQQALGEWLQIDPSNLVGLLNELEDEGWALRRRDPADRRRHIVELSDDGAQRITGVEDIVRGVEQQLLAVLDEGERDQLRALLARVVERALAEDAEELRDGDRDGELAPAAAPEAEPAATR